MGTRKLTVLGHNVRLIPPQYVKPFVKPAKNDRNDAEAICEAAGRPGMLFVLAKSAEQQAQGTVLKVRETHGIGGRVLGTVVGVLAGSVVGAEILIHVRGIGNSEGPAVTTWFASTAGVTTIGYFLGSNIDHHVTIIRIVP